MKKAIQITVRDSFRWAPDDADLRRVVSLRDGILEYGAEELGLEGGVVRVYRSPATIANVATVMIGCPVTDGHVDMDGLIGSDVRLGEVHDAKAIDLDDPQSKARLAVENLIRVGDGRGELWQQYRDEGREFSLGYSAMLLPAHDGADYDYEQREIDPHHLAVVRAGRCGPACTFVDARPVNTKQEDEMKDLKKRLATFVDGDSLSFADATLEELQAILTALPGALAKMDIGSIQKLTKPIMTLAEAAGITGAMAPEEGAAPEAEAQPEGAGMDQEAAPATSMEKLPEPAMDEAMVAKRIADAIAEHTAVIERARLFVDGEYKIAGKSSAQIMRDVLAQERPGVAFSDAELPTAFKLLLPSERKPKDYSNFGDQARSSVAKWLADDKEV